MLFYILFSQLNICLCSYFINWNCRLNEVNHWSLFHCGIGFPVEQDCLNWSSEVKFKSRTRYNCYHIPGELVKSSGNPNFKRVDQFKSGDLMACIDSFKDICQYNETENYRRERPTKVEFPIWRAAEAGEIGGTKRALGGNSGKSSSTKIMDAQFHPPDARLRLKCHS